ncbi:hypothetical protein [Streptomyces sp. PH10-H1]|uniref:hypothetical protein n=1 Tax=Streptomyces sp. PH10-H1 TaxID=3046212 RepID=UPI0024B92852|nr:hypothetical protein [Streptomyces sp. PH10-H1]MDJ0341776.1 hypothetical protein [Streptomyces sp. PH10-H1]
MTALERFLNAHRDHGYLSRQSGSGYVGQCSGHDDRTPSMSINYDGGKVLLCCQVGCATEDIVAAIGLNMSDLFDEKPKPRGRPQKYVVVDSYEYENQRGAVLFVKERKEPGKDGRDKDFSIYRPLTGGKRSYSLKGLEERPLFRLPRVLAAIEKGEPVYLPEGEKDVKAAERAGVTATCNFDGAAREGQRTKWKPEYGDTLKGAHVVIVQDNDEAGRAHAAAAYRDLLGKAASVRIVQGLVQAEHSDLSDHLAAGYTLDELVDVLAPADGQTPTAPSSPPRPKLAPLQTGESIEQLYARLFDQIGEYLHLEDPAHIRFALAAGVSSALDGDPLWGMIVGPPSGGKTEAVGLLDDVTEEHVDDITGPALLSWTQGKNPRPTGILTRVGSRAFVSISDFSTILASSDRGGRDVLFSLLRRAYDGEVNREVGNTPDPLVWRGRLTLLAAVTPAIDNFSSHSDALGPRWLYCRTADTDAEHKKAVQRKRRRMTDLKAKQEEARRTATALVYAARGTVREIELDDETYDALEDAASLTCLGRAAVPRHAYGRREIDGVPVIEEPGRVTGQIVALAKSLIALGEPVEHAVALARKCALDTLPQARLRVLEQLANGEQMTVSTLSATTGLHRHVARRALEDMEVLDMTQCPRTEEAADSEESGFPTSNPWNLGEEAGLITKVLRAKRMDDLKIAAGSVPLARSVGSHPPTPQIKELENSESRISDSSHGDGSHTSCQVEPQAGPSPVPEPPADDGDLWDAPLEDPDDYFADAI